MKYTVQFSKTASKALAEINARDRQRIYEKILKLGDNPRPLDFMSMAGSFTGNLRVRIAKFRVINNMIARFGPRFSKRRIKVGNFRVIYKVDDSRQLVLMSILATGRRFIANDSNRSSN